MSQRVLVLDNSTEHAVYRPVDEWARNFAGVPFDAVSVPLGEPIPPLDGYTHLLLTGSHASASEPAEPWFEAEADVVRAAADRGLAILGSCFGHQLLAWALSGPSHVRRAPMPELGWTAVDILLKDSLFAGVASPWHTFAAHLDEVVDPPTPWRVLAANESCAVQAMRYGDRPIWGIQPHPETRPDEARRQMERALTRYPEFAVAIRQALQAPVRDDGSAPKIAAAFLAAPS